jgi:hypothetical protein
LNGYLKEREDAETTSVIKATKFELNNLSQEITSYFLKELKSEIITSADEQELKKEYIDPEHLAYTKMEAVSYIGDKGLTKKEIRNAKLVDRYRNANRDKNTAIEGILNATEEKFKKSDIRSIDWDDLTNILDDIITKDFLDDVTEKDTNGEMKIDKDKFRKKFKDDFIKTDRYNKK